MSDKATILIVDTDETSSLLLKEILLSVLPHIYKILLMSDGSEAADVCRGQKPKAVFTEIRVKGMDGIRLTKYIKELDPGIPVIIQTAIPREHVRQQVCECCCDGYLTKPLDLTELRKQLKSVFHLT